MVAWRGAQSLAQLAPLQRLITESSDARAALGARARPRFVTAASARTIGAAAMAAGSAFDHVCRIVEERLNLGSKRLFRKNRQRRRGLDREQRSGDFCRRFGGLRAQP